MFVSDGIACDDGLDFVLGQRLIDSITSVKAVATVRVQRQPRDRCIQRVGEFGTMIDVAIIDSNRACQDRVFDNRTGVDDCDRRIVRAGDSQRQRRDGRRAMFVGDGVVRDDGLDFIFGQSLIRRMTSVEAIAAVGVERKPRDRCVQRVRQLRAMIDIAVVRRDRTRQDRIFDNRASVHDRNRRVVRAGDRQGQRRRGGRTIFVGHGVGRDDGLHLTLGQRLIGRVAGIEAVAAIRIQRQARDRRVQGVGELRVVIDVMVVARDRAGDDRAVLDRRIGDIGDGDRGVVGADQGHRHLLVHLGAILVGDRDDIVLDHRLALGEVLQVGIVDREGPADLARAVARRRIVDDGREMAAIIILLRRDAHLMRVDQVRICEGDGAGDGGRRILDDLAARHGGGDGRRVVGAGQRDRHVLGRRRAELVGQGQHIDLGRDLAGREPLHAGIVGGEAPVDGPLRILVGGVLDDLGAQRAEAARRREARRNAARDGDARGTDADAVRVGQIDVAEGDRAVAGQRRRRILDHRALVTARDDRGAVILAGDRHRDGRGRHVAVRIGHRIGEAVDRLLALREILIIGRVGRVDDIGDRIGGIGIILGQRHRAMRGIADRDRAHLIGHRVVGEQVERQRCVILVGGDRIGARDHGFVARIEQQAVDHDLELLDPADRQVEGVELERAIIFVGAQLGGHAREDAVRLLIQERDIARDIGLDVAAQPFVTREDQPQRVGVAAAVIGILRREP